MPSRADAMASSAGSSGSSWTGAAGSAATNASSATVAATTASAITAATTTTTVVVAAATATAEAAAATTIVAAPVQDDPEDPVDVVIASALEGINLALSMDNLLGFSAMSPLSRTPEIQGEPPQVISLSSPLSKGELRSTVSLITSSGNISSFMDMLFGSKTLKCSDPPK